MCGELGAGWLSVGRGCVSVGRGCVLVGRGCVLVGHGVCPSGSYSWGEYYFVGGGSIISLVY
jgi:hypothetical protein